MPMNFPDMKSLEQAAKVHKFRSPLSNETEEHYREALADYVASIDFVESQEIRFKVGWDQWNSEQKLDGLMRKGFYK